MSPKSEQVDRLIREHLSLNESLSTQGTPTEESQIESGVSAARVTEIRQELVQIFQTPEGNS